MNVLVIYGYGGFHGALAKQEDVQVSVLSDFVPQKNAERRLRVFPFNARATVDLRAARQVRKVLREVRPDVVHAFGRKGLAASLLATMGVKHAPKIVSFRGITAPVRRRDPSNWISYLHPRVAGHACESNAVRDAMVSSGFSNSACGVTYGCVSPRILEQPGRGGLAPWNVPEEAFVVGAAANMRPVKGMDLLLEAAIACSDLKDVYYVLIGRPRDRRVLRLAEDPRIRERVRLLGFQPKAASLITGADVFVMPSRSEGLCVSLLEAMAQGICPVVSDAGGMKEAVRHGQDGLVFPREDVAALAQAIRALHQDRPRAAAFAQSAAGRARQFFSPEQMATRAVALYRRVLAA